ncbi:HdeD family acid-resistance protein [Methylobacterium marchantiae]|uniref:HdeD family acid-resistance protein n=1 Tax=Methylobacterium marchantiae TaxID=600331 RepID=A0ABW3X197_9HYPH|nr:hypothetical protein AIGOOFII_0208 [Methylobacterium marchantiae]
MTTGTSLPPQSGSPPPRVVPPIGRERLDAMSSALARNWWLIALRGAFAILFGAIAFIAPGAFVLSLVLFFAAYMLVDGITAVLSSIRAAQRHERWGYLLANGSLDIVVAVAAVMVPAAAVWAFVYLIAFWALIAGGLMIAAAFRLHLHYGRWWLGLGGAVSILFGIALLINPGMSALVLAWWMGAYTMLFGAMLLILAFRLRGRHGETLRA